MNLEQILYRSLGKALKLFKENLLIYLVTGLLGVLLTILSLGFLSGPLLVGLLLLIQKNLKGEKIRIADLFLGIARNDFLTLLAAGILLLGSSLILGSVFYPLAIVLLFGGLFTFHFLAYTAPLSLPNACKKSVNLVKREWKVILPLFSILALLNTIGCRLIIGALFTLPFSLIVLSITFEEMNNTL